MPANAVPVNGNNPSDRELEERARDTLTRYATLRIWGHAVSIEAHNGVITLGGHVRTRTGKETAERLIRETPGVTDVKNELYVDTDLEIAVARALAENPVTANSFPGILVGSGFGEVFLKGHVVSAEVKQAAGDIAAGIPGVIRVVNELATPGSNEPLTPASEDSGHST